MRKSTPIDGWRPLSVNISPQHANVYNVLSLVAAVALRLRALRFLSVGVRARVRVCVCALVTAARIWAELSTIAIVRSVYEIKPRHINARNRVVL